MKPRLSPNIPYKTRISPKHMPTKLGWGPRTYRTSVLWTTNHEPRKGPKSSACWTRTTPYETRADLKTSLYERT